MNAVATAVASLFTNLNGGEVEQLAQLTEYQRYCD
jgi:hypothetical protein